MKTTQLARFSEALAQLIPCNNISVFSAKLIDFFGALVPLDDATIVYFPYRKLPVVEYFQPLEDGSTRLDQFIQAAFLLDPYYKAGTKGKFGFFKFSDLAPEGFENSEYYRSYYGRSGYSDECGYLIGMGGNSFIHISLARTSGQASFTEERIQLLADISPVIMALCQELWGGVTNINRDEPDLRAQLHSALENFGTSLLTHRETQVINLVLHGYSTKMVTERLNISAETVKLHRKHSYAKMGIGSQAELFYLFVESLMSTTGYKGGDTLETYLKPGGH